MRFCLLLITLFSLPLHAQTRIIPHLTRPNGGFTSLIYLNNPTSTRQTYTLFPYRESGSATLSFSGSINPGDNVVINPASVGGNVSHFTCDMSESVQVSVSYQSTGSPVHLAASNTQAYAWHFYLGDWSYVFDSLAVVNMGTRSTPVEIRQFDDRGRVVDSDTVTGSLAAKAKALYLVNGNFDPNRGNLLEISANEPISLVTLRGSHDQTLLWANTAQPAIPFERAQAKKLHGLWVVAYTIISTFTDQWALFHLPDEPTNSGLYLMSGVDEFGDFVVGGSYLEDLGIYLVISLGSLFNKVYEFELDGEELSGVYYQADENGSRISNYYPLAGERVFEKTRQHVAIEELALPLIHPMPKVRREAYLTLVQTLREK